MRFAFLLLSSVLAAVSWAEVKPPEQAAAPEREQNREWVSAITRLRQQPRPGEIEHGSINTDVASLYALGREDKGKVDELLKAYDAAMVQKAAQWEQELNALRADYETKLLAYVPEGRREAARALLTFSHAHWRSTEDRDLKLTKEYAERIAKLKGLSGADLKTAQLAVRQWLHEQKVQFVAEDQKVLTQLRAFLAPDELERLNAADRDRPAR